MWDHLDSEGNKSSQEPKKSFESFKMQPSRNSDGFNILGSFSTSDFFLFLVIHENIFFIYSCKFTWINLPLGWKKRFRKQLEIGDDLLFSWYPSISLLLTIIDWIIVLLMLGVGNTLCVVCFGFVPWPHSMNECTLTLKTMISVISDFIEERLDYFTPNGIIIYKMNIMSFWRILEKAILLMNSREKMLTEAINQLRNRVIFFP